MNLKITKHRDKQCCFETFENNKRNECGKCAPVIAGRNKYVCKEHALYSLPFAKILRLEDGTIVDRKEFIKSLEDIKEGKS